MKRIYFIVLIMAGILCGCQESKDSTKKDTNNQSQTPSNQSSSQQNNEEATVKLDENVINNILQSIPSPLETTDLIKQVGSDYHKSALNNSDYVDNYTTSYKQAVNLGIYSMNLGYANIYGKNQDILKYLNSIKKLADQLNIGQFFDYNTLKKLTSSNENLDELLQLSTSNFEKINYHLRQQKRDYLSVLILTGGWIEANYVTAVVYEESKSKMLKERLAEQQIVLSKILLVLDVYKTKPNFGQLIADLKILNQAYENVEITIERAEPIMKIEGDEIVIESQDKTTIKVTDEDIKKIIQQLKLIRKKMVK